MTSLPALLGGAPMFDTKQSIVRPALPSWEELQPDLERAITSGMLTKGPFLEQFEQAVADHLQVKHAVAVSSCTTGLMLTYKALELSGEVIVPSFTFMATVSSLVWAGCKPVFADANAATMTVDPTAVEARITPRTSAIVAVHNFGNPADIDALQALATKYQLKLIFDAAHGFGAVYQGKPVGAQGDANVYSLSPTKLLITGEGGVVATNDDELARRIRVGREYGNDGKYDSEFAGINARMPELSAILGIHSLKQLEGAAKRRNEVAALFQENLGRLPGIGFQEIRRGNRSSYREYTITIDADEFGLSRNQVAAALSAENVDNRKYYDPPAHRQMAYAAFANGADLSNTDQLAERCLSLPMWSHMSDEVALNICAAFDKIQAHTDALRSI